MHPTMIDLPALVADYLALLADEGISDPLDTPLRLAVVLADLFSLAGLPVPRGIEDRLDEPCGRPLVAA